MLAIGIVLLQAATLGEAFSCSNSSNSKITVSWQHRSDLDTALPGFTVSWQLLNMTKLENMIDSKVASSLDWNWTVSISVPVDGDYDVQVMVPTTNASAVPEEVVHRCTQIPTMLKQTSPPCVCSCSSWYSDWRFPVWIIATFVISSSLSSLIILVFRSNRKKRKARRALRYSETGSHSFVLEHNFSLPSSPVSVGPTLSPDCKQAEQTLPLPSTVRPKSSPDFRQAARQFSDDMSDRLVIFPSDSFPIRTLSPESNWSGANSPVKQDDLTKLEDSDGRPIPQEKKLELFPAAMKSVGDYAADRSAGKLVTERRFQPIKMEKQEIARSSSHREPLPDVKCETPAKVSQPLPQGTESSSKQSSLNMVVPSPHPLFENVTEHKCTLSSSSQQAKQQATHTGDCAQSRPPETQTHSAPTSASHAEVTNTSSVDMDHPLAGGFQYLDVERSFSAHPYLEQESGFSSQQYLVRDDTHIPSLNQTCPENDGTVEEPIPLDCPEPPIKNPHTDNPDE